MPSREHGLLELLTRAVVVVALLVLPVQKASAEEMLPVDLVLELLDVAPRWGSKDPELLIGALPAGLTEEFDLPEGVEVLVSVSRGETASIIGRSALSKAQIGAGFEASLSETGWELDRPEAETSGFQPTQQDQGKTFCHEQGGSISLNVASLSPEETSIHLTHHGDPYGGRGCGAQRRAMMMELREDIPFPTLYPPENSKSHGGGSSSSSEHSLQQSTDVQVEMTAGELLAHYAGQLGAQGWQPDAAIEYKSVAYQSWILLDEAGNEWHGLMLVIPTLRKENQHQVSMRVSRIGNG